MRSLAGVSLCFLLAAPYAAGLAQPPDNPVLAQAQILVQAGKAEEVWQLLAPLEVQYAGQPDFDYLLGVAALESGRPNRATFILERVIAVNPGHQAARLEMGRAYFALQDFERAEREFAFILASQPPPAIRTLVSGYLDRMGQAAAAAAPKLSGYAEVGVGRDSNVTAAAAQGVFPGLGGEFVLDPALSRRPDDFLGMGAGIEYARPFSPNLSLSGGADLRVRAHSTLDTLDTRAVDLHAGLRHRLDERNSVHYTLRHNEYGLDQARYRHFQSATAQWSRTRGPRTRISLTGQGYRVRYVAQGAQVNNSDLVAAGASAAHVLDEATHTVVVGAINLGYDNATAGRTDGDRRLQGFSLALQRRLAARLDGFLSLSLLQSSHAEANPDFGGTRRDRQQDATAGLSWEFARGWFLRPQIWHTDNRSNLPVYAYRRTETSLTLRRVWD